MEMIEASRYRTNLAKQIKEMPKDQRRDFLEQERKTGQYRTARDLTISERRERIETKRLIEKQRETLRGGESPEAILNGAQAFTSELLKTYPQINEDEELYYYISGSLAVMLLLIAGKFEILDEGQIPNISVTAQREIPQDSIRYLISFARKIGDLDYVETDLYVKKKREVSESYGEVSDHQYRQNKQTMLYKGGGGA